MAVTHVEVVYAIIQIDALDENGEEDRPNGVAEGDTQEQTFPRCLDVPEADHFHEESRDTHRPVLLISRHYVPRDFLPARRSKCIRTARLSRCKWSAITLTDGKIGASTYPGLYG